jgi:hypothetical protein
MWINAGDCGICSNRFLQHRLCQSTGTLWTGFRGKKSGSSGPSMNNPVEIAIQRKHYRSDPFTSSQAK